MASRPDEYRTGCIVLDSDTVIVQGMYFRKIQECDGCRWADVMPGGAEYSAHCDKCSNGHPLRYEKNRWTDGNQAD